jgi:hypothetical protein
MRQVRSIPLMLASITITMVTGCVVTRPHGIDPEVELRPLEPGWTPELQVDLFDAQQWHRTELDTKFDVVVWGHVGGMSWLDSAEWAYFAVRVANQGEDAVAVSVFDPADPDRPFGDVYMWARGESAMGTFRPTDLRSGRFVEVPSGARAELWFRDERTLHPPRVGDVIRLGVVVKRGESERAFPFVFEVAKVRRKL